MAVLQPGLKLPVLPFAAGNLNQQLSLADHQGKRLVLLLVPADFGAELAGRLAQFAERLPDFHEQNAVVAGISPAGRDRLTRLAAEKEILFPLLCDPDPSYSLCRRYGVLSPDGQVLPTVFVADEEGLIRRVYEAVQYPDLPNPAIVLRALSKLAEAASPAPVSTRDWQHGAPDAPVQLIEYSDYQCAHCAELYAVMEHEVLPAYGNRLLVVHRHLPLRHSHPLAWKAAEAAEAAGLQGRFWEMHGRLFSPGMRLERQQLSEYAGEIGLDAERFAADLDGGRLWDAVNEDFQAAVHNRIKLPPSLFFNGILWEGPRTGEAMAPRIESLLSCSAIDQSVGC